MASWLSANDVAALTQVSLDGHATLAAVNGTQNIAFARWSAYKASLNNPNPYDTIAAQACLVEFTDSQAQSRDGDPSGFTVIDGYLQRPTPFDVQTGDLFSVGTAPQEQACVITYVEPAKLGLQRAHFRMRVGEQ